MFQGHANQFKCTYRKLAIRELFLNERQKGGRENVSVFGGVHDPREDHKLYGSLCRYSSPPLEFSVDAYAYTSAFWASSSESLSFCGTAVGLLTH